MRQMLGLKFRRQHPLGIYILDFACVEAALLIELDGSQHMDRPEKDVTRSAWLETQGWKTLRFWNNEVMQNMDGVLENISLCLIERGVGL